MNAASAKGILFVFFFFFINRVQKYDDPGQSRNKMCIFNAKGLPDNQVAHHTLYRLIYCGVVIIVSN